MPFAFIPFLLLIVPIVEIGAFIIIGGQIGVIPTLLMILVTAIVGTFLLRQQGLQLVNKIQTEMNAGKVPGKALSDGAMILVAGILLLTPGFVTDSIGFLLFVPGVRTVIWTFLASKITMVTPQGFGQSAGFGQQSPFQQNDAGSNTGPVIDLDEDDYETGPPNPNSPWNDKSR